MCAGGVCTAAFDSHYDGCSGAGSGRERNCCGIAAKIQGQYSPGDISDLQRIED